MISLNLQDNENNKTTQRRSDQTRTIPVISEMGQGEISQHWHQQMQEWHEQMREWEAQERAKARKIWLVLIIIALLLIVVISILNN